jgi:hypothetical protein
MKTISDSTYVRSAVVIDDTSFIRCTFTDCVLVYNGGTRTGFDSCTFNGVPRVSLGESALNTMAVFHGFAALGLDEVVARIQELIAAGVDGGVKSLNLN